MNPYEVLGVPANASHLQIKKAYYKLVKQYHPDAQKHNASHDHMARINAAYDILSDPARKRAYDNPLSELVSVYEEDPVEAYKREFKRKRWEKEKEEKERRLRHDKLVYKYLRFASMPLLLFGFLLVLDSVLPANVFSEKAEEGWQKRYGGKYGSSYISYMRTHSFVLAIANEIHVNYPYYEKEKPPLLIEVSPIFHIPRHVTVTLGERIFVANVKDTVFYWIPFHYLLLISAAFIVWRKEYSRTAYIASVVPIIILCMVIIRFLKMG